MDTERLPKLEHLYKTKVWPIARDAERQDGGYEVGTGLNLIRGGQKDTIEDPGSRSPFT
jgi:hypothetical protein